jgi:flagellin-specific chaperone FliS
MHLAGVVRQLNKERDRTQAKVEHLDKALDIFGKLERQLQRRAPEKAESISG